MGKEKETLIATTAGFEISSDLSELSKLPKGKMEKVIAWWAKGTIPEKHLCNETIPSLHTVQDGGKVIEGVVAFKGGAHVGATAILAARTKDGSGIQHDNRTVVEVGSVLIRPEFRNNGVGRELVYRQLELIREKQWCGVSVTSNPAMAAVFRKVGGRIMDNDPGLVQLRNALCMCPHVSPDCNYCPLLVGAAWIFD